MKTIKIGLVGLGRLGRRRVENLLITKGCEISAVCAPFEEDQKWAKEHLPDAEMFIEYDAMLQAKQVDAIFIATPSTLHAEQIIPALEAGYHVFTEKPMALTVEDCENIERVAKKHPNQVFLVGFVRRFEPNFAGAKKIVDSGELGEVYLVRTQTADHYSGAEFQTNFSMTSGGIFLDYNVHDIDYARWVLGSEVKSVHTIGGSYMYPKFAEMGDADSAISLCEFEDGKMAVISASRIMPQSHDSQAEIVGTKGILRISPVANKNRIEILDNHGARQELMLDFYELYKPGFEVEAQYFVDCVRGTETCDITAFDGTQATRVGIALRKSFTEKRTVLIEEI